MRKALAAGLAYFLAVFAAGFVLGTVRVLWLVPALGGTAAVLAELPVMLAIAWMACRWTLRTFAVPGAPTPRLVMGATAFALLMAAEMALSTFLFDRSLSAYLAAFLSLSGALGLAGQIAFALFPSLQARG